MHPLTLPLWLAGLYCYLVRPEGKPYRALGWAYLVLLLVFAVQGVKFYFLAPAYPMLFAAGAVLLDGAFRRLPTAPGPPADDPGTRPRRVGRWIRPAALGLLGATGALMMPMVVPVLPPEQF